MMSDSMKIERAWGEARAESGRDDQPTKQVKVGIGRNHDV
jgi:hypothetical protein